jgi:hypothetical protein
LINNTHYVPHEWNVICDVCGFKYKASQLKKRWDGLMVCDKDWETRHPQELIRTPTEKPVLWTRPEGVDVFVDVTYVGPSVGTQDLVIPSGTFNNDL